MQTNQFLPAQLRLQNRPQLTNDYMNEMISFKVNDQAIFFLTFFSGF